MLLKPLKRPNLKGKHCLRRCLLIVIVLHQVRFILYFRLLKKKKMNAIKQIVYMHSLGTEFMGKLSLQLQYFINKKVTEDSDWRDIKIVLSGHEVPGEGEHKIMEYIRNSKAQADYNPNVRHCLYG